MFQLFIYIYDAYIVIWDFKCVTFNTTALILGGKFIAKVFVQVTLNVFQREHKGYMVHIVVFFLGKS